MDPELERRILACPTLPSLPAIALELLRLCRDEETDLRSVAETISRDPALSARVLRAANSASLAVRGKVSTLTRAIPLLGSNATLALALSFSLVRCRRRGDLSGFDHAAFWRRAVFSALAGRVLAESGVCAADPEEAFLGALLQDLGMLALAEVLAPEYGPLFASTDGDHAALVAAERQAWGCDHAEVSALLARTWSLPTFLEEALAASHEPPAGERRGHLARLGECVRASGPLADVWVASEAGGRHAVATARAALGPDSGLLERMIERMALAVPEASADFDIDLGEPARVEATLTEAHRLRALKVPSEPIPGGAARVHRGEALDAALCAAFARAAARGAPVSLLALRRRGLDGGGPEEVVRFLARTVRPTDLLGVEGEDVILLLPETPLAGARAVAARILANAPAALRPDAPIAIGIATARGADSTPAALRAAALAALASTHRASGDCLAVADPGGSGR